MEWVETTGRTVEEAKDEALDRLGVDEQDAEFDVVEEPRPGLFGRMRGEARVRARVTPKAPPPKQERRDRKRRDRPAKSASSTTSDDSAASTEGDGGLATETEVSAPARSASGGRRGGGRRGAREESPPEQDTRAPISHNGHDAQDSGMSENVTVEEQADIMATFLEGLTDAFGYEANIVRTAVDEETIELNLEGEDLGLLIGPKGATLAAVQDLARTVVQRTATGTHEGRVRIDVSGYRQRRRVALERFTRQVAEQVTQSGVQKALEPMAAVDRKVVHDTVNSIDGVVTTSEGEEPRRRVVILPSND